MARKPKKTSGKLVLGKIKFDNIVKKKVISNNKSSSKVTLPKAWEGKEVYIVVEG